MLEAFKRHFLNKSVKNVKQFLQNNWKKIFFWYFILNLFFSQFSRFAYFTVIVEFVKSLSFCHIFSSQHAQQSKLIWKKKNMKTFCMYFLKSVIGTFCATCTAADYPCLHLYMYYCFKFILVCRNQFKNYANLHSWITLAFRCSRKNSVINSDAKN